MISAQEEILDVCDKLHTYAEKAELAQEKTNSIESIQKSAAQQRLLVPIVGQFSAGKSTMINTILGESILPVGITPETSLATEIHYSNSDQYAEGIDQNGQAHRYELTDMKNLTAAAQKYRFARVYIDNIKIKDLEPLILVDMPGFDAPLEHHNKAIAEYIDKGLYYIVLSKVSDGTISRTLLNRLREIHTGGRMFSLFLSNADLETPAKLEQVKQHCTEILEDNFGGVHHIEAINNTSAESVLKCLNTIDTNALVKNLYYTRINDCTNTVLEGLNYRIKAFDLETSSIQSAQDELKRSIEKIKATAEQDIRHMKNKYSGSMINNIVNDVGAALENAADEIVSAIMSKSGGTEALFNEIIRSAIIASFERRIGEANDSIVMDFSDSVKGLSDVLKNMDIDLNYMDKIITRIQDLFKSLPIASPDNHLPKTVNSILGGMAGTGLSTLLTGSIGTTISSATAVVGTIINPILGGVLAIGLPLIMSLLGQKSQNDHAESQIRAKLVGEVFPQIKGKLRTELPGILQEQVGKMIAQVQEQYQQVLQSQQAEFEKAMQEKKASEEENKQKKELYTDFRQDVQNILETITAWRMS